MYIKFFLSIFDSETLSNNRLIREVPTSNSCLFIYLLLLICVAVVDNSC